MGVWMLCTLNSPASHAQSSPKSTETERLEQALQPLGAIDLFVFGDRAAFLTRIDQTLGLANIKDPEKTFARLPRSPFTVTGRQNGKQISTCQIFIPAGIAPESGNEIFAQLLRGWLGPSLRYQSSAGLTYAWLIYHEARHCRPDHHGGDSNQEHHDEIVADLFAFDAVATEGTREGLAADIMAFRVITSALFAGENHMIGLSIKYALEKDQPVGTLLPKQEIAAFRAARKMVTTQTKSIALAPVPTNRELIRAISQLRERVQNGELAPENALAGEILIALDQSIAALAPRLHAQSTAPDPG